VLSVVGVHAVRTTAIDSAALVIGIVTILIVFPDAYCPARSVQR
jgi:hypothetical protein